MKLISTTLTASQGEVIEDALRSVVDWVDECLIIDTGVADDTLVRARDVAGDKYRCVKLPWQDDFAVARNFALDAAAAHGGTWAVTVDTDERIALHGEPIREILSSTSSNCFYVMTELEDYGKERFFRLPMSARWVGRTHEAFITETVGRERLPLLRFHELPKTPKQLLGKRERDVSLLKRQTRELPNDPRWFYYLGDSLQGLARHKEAIRAYAQCEALPGWDEQRAWCCFKAAECHVALGQFDEAVAACARGLGHHAGIAELAWYAGYASSRAGRPEQAKWWAYLSESMGHFTGRGPEVPRFGFRFPRGLYEGPFDVLLHAHQKLGEEAASAKALYLFEAAKRARERQRRG